VTSDQWRESNQAPVSNISNIINKTKLNKTGTTPFPITSGLLLHENSSDYWEGYRKGGDSLLEIKQKNG